MCRWTLTINLLWFCFFQCHIVCDDNFYDQQGHVTHRTFRHSKPSGKALEDICDCDSIEIVTSKVNFQSDNNLISIFQNLKK